MALYSSLAGRVRREKFGNVFCQLLIEIIEGFAFENIIDSFFIAAAVDRFLFKDGVNGGKGDIESVDDGAVVVALGEKDGNG